MTAPTHIFFSATALGVASLVSLFGSVVATDIDPQSCTVSPDNAGCQMHRPVELDAAEAADVPWRMAEDFQEPEGDRPATSAQAVDISSSHDLDELAAVKSEPKAAASSDLAEIFDR